jgi:hypothetical protein
VLLVIMLSPMAGSRLYKIAHCYLSRACFSFSHIAVLLQQRPEVIE